MKSFLVAVLLALVFCASAVRAAEPEEDYANIYGTILQGDTLAEKGDFKAAHAKYAEAQKALKQLRTDNPGWNIKAVKYRTDYLADKLAQTAAPPPAAPADASTSAASEPAQSAEPVEMKLKWEVGKRYDQHMETLQTSEMNLPGSATPMKQETKQSQDVSLTVVKERDGGGRELEMKILGMTVVSKAGGRALLSFDSTKPDAAGDPAAPMLRKMVGLRLKFLTDAAGKIESIEGFQDAINRVTADAPAMAQQMMKGMFSEDNFKELYSVGEGLPDKPVKPGDTWPLKQDEALGPLGSLVVNSQYTFKGLENHNDHKCAVIEFTGTLATADSGAAESAMAISGGRTSGKIWFDPALGMIIDSHGQMGMNLKVTAQGTTLVTKVNGTVDNKLVKIADAQPAAQP